MPAAPEAAAGKMLSLSRSLVEQARMPHLVALGVRRPPLPICACNYAKSSAREDSLDCAMAGLDNGPAHPVLHAPQDNCCAW